MVMVGSLMELFLTTMAFWKYPELSMVTSNLIELDWPVINGCLSQVLETHPQEVNTFEINKGDAPLFV